MVHGGLTKEIKERREKSLEGMHFKTPKKWFKAKSKKGYGKAECPECTKIFKKTRTTQICCSFKCQVYRTKLQRRMSYIRISPTSNGGKEK